MLRRILLYVIIGAAIYLGYERYHSQVLEELQRKEQANAQSNQRAVQGREVAGSGQFEQALRRKELTESYVNQNESQPTEKQ